MKTRPEIGLRDIAGYFLRLGMFGFGGPIALASYMQRDLVERRGWVTQEEYLEGLAVAQTMPGPLAAQLAGSGTFGAGSGARSRRRSRSSSRRSSSSQSSRHCTSRSPAATSSRRSSMGSARRSSR
jgi:hypothetical protein